MKMNSRTISRPNTFYHWKEGGGGGKTEEDNWLETYFSAEIQTLIVIAGNVTMSHRGERKQCHGIKEQYAARILSHPLLSIYTCGYIVTKRSVFDERWSSATLESFYETSSLEKSRILFYESRNDIYIYVSSSSPFLFFLLYSSRHTRTVSSFQFDRYASRIDRSWKTTLRNNEEEGIVFVGCLACWQ